MAKEVIIIFVYDTEILQKEEDDPASAILYFHPTWVSDQQKTALCGQIVGTIRCLKSIFSAAKIVSLQSGKFYIIENGRYLLATGTDRNISEWLLEHRAQTLYSLINFFHNDFISLSQIYSTSENLSAKLYHMFETYLKMLIFGGNIFSHIPTLALPKSASNVFTEAIQLLQCCQELDNVLGGSIMYHNKIVATQLSADMTKRIVLTDPYRIKCPAESAEIDFDLPLGVQLLQVYVPNSEYCSLLNKRGCIFQYLSNKSIKKTYTKASSMQDPIISQMKRDQSLLFTMVPEEDIDNCNSTAQFLPTNKKTRPKFLNLKTNSIDSNNIEPKINPKLVPTPFCGQTSVCSTPMVELKKFVHQNPLSICVNPTDDKRNISPSPSKTALIKEKNINFEQIIQYSSMDLFCDIKKCSSLFNLSSINDLKEQYFENSESTLPLSKVKRSKSIVDPTFPLFKIDGKVLSHSLFTDSIKTHLNLNNTDIKNNSISIKNGSVKSSKILPESSVEKQKPFDISEVITNSKLNKNRENRKSLTLPLKSLSMDSSEQVTSPIPLTNRKYSSGVQLTPLMSRLSMLAFEERSSGFGSQATTPGDCRGLTPTQNYPFSFNKLKVTKEVKQRKSEDNTLQKCILFVCGQQDVVLIMLLKEDCIQTSKVVRELWEICTEHLSKLEKQLRMSMESQAGGSSHESEPYSYLLLDSDWDTVDRGGPWGTNDVTVLNYLHRDLSENSNITDILMRGFDSVIYGNHCGQTEVYYHESAPSNGGLPPPADPMGQIQLKARRRLERDHAIILL